MALRPILVLPDPRLKEVSLPVETVDEEVRALARDMLETMYDAPGIGLAAIQIGVPRRVVVTDVAKPADEGEEQVREPMVFVNPEIVWTSQERRVYEEGCLSIPEYYEEVERPDRVRVRYLDLDGRPQEIEAGGLLATCLQHEIDHLNGVLYVDLMDHEVFEDEDDDGPQPAGRTGRAI